MRVEDPAHFAGKRAGGLGLLEAKMGRKLIFIIGIIVALVAVGAGSFYGGTVYAAQQTANTRNAFFNGRGGTGAGGTGGNGGGGGVSGTIKSISGDTIQVSTALSVTTVNVGSSTTVLKT